MARIKNPDTLQDFFYLYGRPQIEMPKTHQELIEALEARLLSALIACDKAELQSLLHPNFVLTNENGEVFPGIEKLQINQPKILRILTTKIEERVISFFNNVAVVSSFETRTGTFHDMHFERQYRITRIWKFHGRNWKMIAATVVLP
jgi:ketosteroid isomerase-like protein